MAIFSILAKYLQIRDCLKGQGRSGLGLEAQKRDIELFLSNYAECGSVVVGSFTEVQSGSSDDRPKLLNALDACRREGATLLAARLDRLSRKVSLISQLIEDQSVNF